MRTRKPRTGSPPSRGTSSLSPSQTHAVTGDPSIRKWIAWVSVTNRFGVGKSFTVEGGWNHDHHTSRTTEAEPESRPFGQGW